MVFADRRQAGELLAEHLWEYSSRDDVLVLAIPRGGVLVGAEIAKKLKVALDVIVTKKIGAPDNSELAIGAVAEDGEPIFAQDLLQRLRIETTYLNTATAEVHEKIREQIQTFRHGRELKVADMVVIVTDDGVATGSTVEAALHWLRSKNSREIILAIPTGARDSMVELEKLSDKTICLDQPRWFAAVGQFYREFSQVSNKEVQQLLRDR